MTPFLWSAGHLGWSLFGIVVLSFTSLLVADIVWRRVRLPFWKLLVVVGSVWLAGVVALVTLYFA
jgi:hypothetical protein